MAKLIAGLINLTFLHNRVSDEFRGVISSLLVCYIIKLAEHPRCKDEQLIGQRWNQPFNVWVLEMDPHGSSEQPFDDDRSSKPPFRGLYFLRVRS